MKLNEEKVKVIQRLFEITDYSDGKIAEFFEVDRVTINHIRHGHRWSSVTGISKNTPTSKHKPVWFNKYVEDYLTDKIKEMVKNDSAL